MRVPNAVQSQVKVRSPCKSWAQKNLYNAIYKPPYTKTYMHQVILYSHPGVVPFPDFVESLSHNMEKMWKLHIYCCFV